MKIAMATQAHRWLIAFVLLSIGLTVLMLNHEPAALIARVQMIVGDSPQAAWLLFAVLTLISQLLIVPSGSLLLMAGGFLLGAMPAALIYALIQVLTTWPVLWLGRNGGMERAERHLETLSPMLSRMAQALREAPFSLALVLRLTPVIPSAVACLLSVAFSVPRSVFLLATTLVCWVRPVFFASIGAAVPALSRLARPADVLDAGTLWPLLLAFVGAVALLMSRLWVNHRLQRALAKQLESADS